MQLNTLSQAGPEKNRWLRDTCILSPQFWARQLRRQEGSRHSDADGNLDLCSIATDLPQDDSVPTRLCQRYLLWIDGVGAWQLLIGHRFLIGAPTLETQEADICLMANISRKHATIERIDQDWFIRSHQSTVVSGRTVPGQALLRTGDEIRLAERVRLGFRIPSVLSASAVVDFESGHRPMQTVNGLILMTDSCLLGPRQDYHVFCQDWSDLVVLFAQNGELRCRSKQQFRVDGSVARDAVTLQHGSIVTGDDFRFRVERMDG